MISTKLRPIVLDIQILSGQIWWSKFGSTERGWESWVKPFLFVWNLDTFWTKTCSNWDVQNDEFGSSTRSFLWSSEGTKAWNIQQPNSSRSPFSTRSKHANHRKPLWQTQKVSWNKALMARHNKIDGASLEQKDCPTDPQHLKLLHPYVASWSVRTWGKKWSNLKPPVFHVQKTLPPSRQRPSRSQIHHHFFPKKESKSHIFSWGSFFFEAGKGTKDIFTFYITKQRKTTPKNTICQSKKIHPSSAMAFRRLGLPLEPSRPQLSGSLRAPRRVATKEPSPTVAGAVVKGGVVWC